MTPGPISLPNLLAGHYQIEVKRQGFADALTTSIALENGTTRRINVALTMGKVAETVEVTSAAAIVKTDDANVSEVIENKFVRGLAYRRPQLPELCADRARLQQWHRGQHARRLGPGLRDQHRRQAVERRRHRVRRRLLHRRPEQQRQLGGRSGDQRQHGRDAGSQGRRGQLLGGIRPRRRPDQLDHEVGHQ